MMNNGRETKIYKSGPESRATYSALLFHGTCLTPSATIVRKSALDKVDGFTEDHAYRTAEDYELWLKLARSGARFKFLSEALTRYRIHDGGASHVAAVHLNAGIKIVTDHFQSLPQKTAANARQYRHRLASLYCSAARKFIAAGDRGNASSAAWAGLRNHPWYPRAYALAALSIIPRIKF